MVQPRLVLMSLMEYFLSAHGSGSFTRMVSTCMVLYIVHIYLLFEISVINVAFCCDFQEAWRRHLPTFGSQIPALLLSKP